MTLITGLGNPGEKYKKNRHNIGFMVIDAIVDDLNPTKINKSFFNGELYKSSNILFLKPTTYMNNSGLSVVSVVNYYKVDRLIVIHDDLELSLGVIKIKHGGGNAGHNGLKSIDAHYGKNYDRIRLGIGKPQNRDEIINYVLSDFYKEESECIEKMVVHAKDAALFLAKSSLEEACMQFSSKKSLCSQQEV